MCGIIGIIPRASSRTTGDRFVDQVKTLLCLSESRGQDASGLAVVTQSEIIYCKGAVAAKRLLRAPEVQALLRRPYAGDLARPVAVIGHARMETNGTFANNNNNQPVVRDGIVTLHNGIVVNDGEIWKNRPDVERHFQVDTEVVNALFHQELNRSRSIAESTCNVFATIKGSASVSMLFAKYNCLLLATNTGSLYTMTDDQAFYFASERYFLESFAAQAGFEEKVSGSINQLPPRTGLIIDLETVAGTGFSLTTERIVTSKDAATDARLKDRQISQQMITGAPPERVLKTLNGDTVALGRQLASMYADVQPRILALRRCSKCVLPETMPFITFDQQGVCSYCTNYTPVQYQKWEDLERVVAPYRRSNGHPDCLLPFSGGRDSSFGLHVAVKELGLHPVAFSYDWGMLTDLGRRNQARMCGALGVEHILISANIRQKRENIRTNVLAWLRRPHLGTIPLFMAGDKQYFYYINKLQKQMRLPLALYMENRLEKTDFKSGFCGIPPKFNIGHGYNLGLYNKLKMANFYGQRYLRNPSLINSTMFDTMKAFLASYFIPHNYVFLFRYLPWVEEEVASTVINQYDWETSPDIPTTWRIGDGTAPFYNLIYYTVAGFTENDTFRSNQIREGQITREEALAKVEQENYPTIEPIRWYCETIGLDLSYALKRIGTMPRRFNNAGFKGQPRESG